MRLLCFLVLALVHRVAGQHNATPNLPVSYTMVPCVNASHEKTGHQPSEVAEEKHQQHNTLINSQHCFKVNHFLRYRPTEYRVEFPASPEFPHKEHKNVYTQRLMSLTTLPAETQVGLGHTERKNCARV